MRNPAPRALVVTPNRIDAELALSFLAENGIEASAYERVDGLGGQLPADAGCIVLAEEALADSDMPGLRELLANQPAWSDLPVVLVASHGAMLDSLIERAFPSVGNITLLERPLNPLTLVSAVQVGLRGRARQIEVRDLLQNRDEALRQRDEFLAMLAHELRNPLAPMRNAIYLQKKLKVEDALFTKTRDILDRQVGHMTRMVDDLIDVARFERGKIALKRERLDVNDAVKAAVEACLPIVQGRAHELRMDLTPETLFVDADPVRLEQIFANLILNASKFMDAGGEIGLRTRRDGGRVLVAVSDHGIGIRPDMLEAVFRPFIQDDHTLARSAGGLGVGLSIARAVAELHGGTLRARSEGINKGAVFEVRIPLSSAPAAPPAAGPGAAAAPKRRRVLVVEDNADIRESLRLMLALWGHEAMLAGTGNEGLAAALEARPDVALIDIGLPGMSGYEVALQIRAQAKDWPRRIRLVALTGYGQPSDRERARDAGFDTHLLKPVDPDVLSELLSA
jgi:signal transduction histidine kinase/CheY-like chemotaxis protein